MIKGIPQQSNSPVYLTGSTTGEERELPDPKSLCLVDAHSTSLNYHGLCSL